MRGLVVFRRALECASVLGLVLGLSTPCWSQESPPDGEAREEASGPPKAKLELEFSPGVAIPLNTFLAAESASAGLTVENGVGFGMGINLVLDDWEFRYALSILPTSNVRTRWGTDFVSQWNSAFESAGLNDLLVTPNQPDGSLLVDSSGTAISIHHLGFGYRIPLWRSDLTVFVPIGIGMAITTADSDVLARSLYGLTAQTGIGLSWALLPWFNLGGQVRYLFTLSESTTEVAAASVIVQSRLTKDALDTAYHLGHLLHVTASISVDF